MRLIKKDLVKKKSFDQLTNTGQPNTIQHRLNKKITFACDAFLLERIKNALQSRHLAGNYQYANLSQLFRQALQAYQQGLPLTYQRQPHNPKQEISLRLPPELTTFYLSLPAQTKTA